MISISTIQCLKDFVLRACMQFLRVLDTAEGARDARSSVMMARLYRVRLFHKDQHFAKIQSESDMYNTSELQCMDPHCRYSTAITTGRQAVTMRFQGAHYILTCMILGW